MICHCFFGTTPWMLRLNLLNAEKPGIQDGTMVIWAFWSSKVQPVERKNGDLHNQKWLKLKERD